MLKRIKLTAAAVVLAVSVLSMGSQAELPLDHHPVTDAYDGWRLGTQAYTFKKFTFFEAIEKAESLGLNWIEAYPGQTVSADSPDVKMNHMMGSDAREKVKERLAASRVRLVNYGVVRLPPDEAQSRKVYDFAKDFGIETIVAEPKPEAFDMLERLCQEYGIKLAIHNHPKPSFYWNPDKVLEVCKGRSPLIGACADTGHWMRSGINPLEAIKKLEGRIISFHFKDLNEFGNRNAHDVVWGTGKADVKALLAEIDRQGFAGVFSIEYEHNWENSLPEIRRSVAYFNEVAGQIKSSGWRDLLKSDLSNWTFKAGTWTLEEGVLAKQTTRDDIWSKETFGDFALDVEFKLAEHTNSGIFFRTANIKDPVQTGIEIQVCDSYSKGPQVGKHDCGAVYDCLAPSKNMVRKPGEWNRCTVTCKANKIYVVLNGEQIIDMDLNRWTEPHKNPDDTKNKFNTPYKDTARAGRIGFQDHGRPVWYRNVRIKPL